MKEKCTVSSKPRAASARGASTRAPLRRREHRLGHRIGARHRRGGDIVEPVDAHDLFHQIGRAVHVQRQDGGVTSQRARRRLCRSRASSGYGRFRLAADRVRPAASPRRIAKRMVRCHSGGAPATTISDGSPPQNSRISLVASSRPGHDEFRIDAALEAIARIGDDAELAARCARCGPDRSSADSTNTLVVVFGAAGVFAAHDAGNAARGRVVGDHAHRRHRARRSCRPARAAVSPSLASRARILPSSLSASKTCSGRPRSWATRLVTSTSAEIGRSPMAFSRSCTHWGEGPFFTPRIKRPANIGQAAAASGAKFERTVYRARRTCPGTGVTAPVFSVPKPPPPDRARCRTRSVQSPRLGVMATSITGSVKAERVGRRAPDRRVGGKFDDAVMLVGEQKLALRTQHAARFDAADGGDLRATSPLPE